MHINCTNQNHLEKKNTRHPLRNSTAWGPRFKFMYADNFFNFMDKTDSNVHTKETIEAARCICKGEHCQQSGSKSNNRNSLVSCGSGVRRPLQHVAMFQKRIIPECKMYIAYINLHKPAKIQSQIHL